MAPSSGSEVVTDPLDRSLDDAARSSAVDPETWTAREVAVGPGALGAGAQPG